MPIAIVDLFCGIGGLTKGLELAKLNVIAGIDFNESCSYAYEINNNSTFIHKDITLVKPNEIKSLFKKADVRVLVGCTPCQPFSKLTKRYRKEEKIGGREGDCWQKDNKWKLLDSYYDIIEGVLPEVISLENVPELCKEEIFNDFILKLNKLKYKVSYSIVYCPDYGMAQGRKRLVLLASRLGTINLIPPTHTAENYVTVRDVIGNLPSILDGQKNEKDPLHNSAKLSEKNKKRIIQSVQGGTWDDWEPELKLDCHSKKSGKSYGSIYGRMVWDKPSPTITTQFYGYGNGRFGHPEQNRALSMREGALLQSFPNNYIFYDYEKTFSRRELGIHIGNAVPVELGRIIGISIKKHIKEVKYNGKKNHK